MAQNTFACHQSRTGRPSICAGFLLQGANHNLSVRLKKLQGVIKHDVFDGGHVLHENYRAMAVANGVAPTDPALTQCRD